MGRATPSWGQGPTTAPHTCPQGCGILMATAPGRCCRHHHSLCAPGAVPSRSWWLLGHSEGSRSHLGDSTEGCRGADGSVSLLTGPTWALAAAHMDLQPDPCPTPQPNPAMECLCRGDRAAGSPLTCGEDTDPPPLCHALRDVPSAGSRGLLCHTQGIVVAIRGSVLGPGRGLWDRHRGPWQ